MSTANVDVSTFANSDVTKWAPGAGTGVVVTGGHGGGGVEPADLPDGHRSGSKYSPGSLTTYGQRFRDAVALYLEYLAKPTGFRVPLKVVQETLGHSTIRLTADTYGHLMPGDSDRAAEAMNRVLDPSSEEFGYTNGYTGPVLVPSAEQDGSPDQHI